MQAVSLASVSYCVYIVYAEDVRKCCFNREEGWPPTPATIKHHILLTETQK